MKGYLRTLRSSPRVRICEDAGKYETLQEAKLMKRFDHKNIVRLYGVAPQEEPIMIILEYAAGGSLKVRNLSFHVLCFLILNELPPSSRMPRMISSHVAKQFVYSVVNKAGSIILSKVPTCSRVPFNKWRND